MALFAPASNVTASRVTLCGMGGMLASPTFGMVLRENVPGTFADDSKVARLLRRRRVDGRPLDRLDGRVIEWLGEP